MKKNSTQNQTVSSQVDENEEIEWEVRPGGMLVQKRDDVVDDTAAASTGGPTIKITVSHGPARHEVDENEEIEWEVRPGGMLVQKRDDVVDDTAAASTGGPTIKITVSHGPARHEYLRRQYSNTTALSDTALSDKKNSFHTHFYH
uniref:Uncharacterized protein n=1 Tax=Fagus sylvatica TaxID=28930 RepID=A0A2N9GNU4_FAGSY